MKRRDGFTLIELLITITIMVILLTLVVVNLRSSMAQARDDKRKSDVEAIARGLERRYTDGNPRAIADVIQKGAYPGVNEMLHAMGWQRNGFSPDQISGGYLTDLLPGTTKESLTPPNNGSFTIICTYSCQPAETQSVIDSQTTTSTYVYEPIDPNGNICPNGGCVRFNLYYRTEVDNVIHQVRSKHQ